MKTRNTRVWIFGIATCGAFILFGKWFLDLPPQNFIKTQEGPVLQYVDYAYGDHQDLKAKTGPWWMFWDQPQYIGVPTRFTKGKIPKGAEVIADQLVLWYYYDLANAAGNRASPGRLSFTRIADELGNKVIQRQVNFQTRSSGSRYFQGFVTPSFPRRGKKIKAEYFSQSFKAVDGTVTLVNPSYKTYPQWTPPPLPASQTRNGVTLSITKCFLSHCIYKLYPKWKFGQGREQTEKESTKELAPCISTSFHVSENGKNKDSEYEIMTGETIDATGNKTTDYFSLYGESKPDATSKPLAYDFKNGVCIGEKALKFVLQVVRSQNAPLSTPGQNRIENLIPPTSNNSLVFKKFVFNRVLAEAAICLGGENVTLSGQYSFNYSSPCLILKVPFSEKLNYNPLVRAKDSAGNLLSDGFSFGDFKYFTGNSSNYTLIFDNRSVKTNWASSLSGAILQILNKSKSSYEIQSVFFVYPLKSPTIGAKINIDVLPNPFVKYQLTAPVSYR